MYNDIIVSQGILQVTTDINNLIIKCFHVTHVSYYFGFLLRAVAGTLSYWTIFIVIEGLKNTTHLACSLLNTSVIIQLSIVWNLDWISNYSDKVKWKKIF